MCKQDFLLDGTKVMDAYRLSILDIDADIDKESNGYHASVKGFHAEYAMYRTIKNSTVCEYEDRGVKHLYERHHGCNDSTFCSICKRTLYGENYKKMTYISWRMKKWLVWIAP